MTFDDSMSHTLSAVAEKAVREQDPHKLRQLILDINMLLDVIEARVVEIDGYSNPYWN